MREDLSKSGLKEIEAKAYLSRKDIEELILPKEVERIGNWAFAHMKNLKKLIVPCREILLGKEVLKGCDSLEQICIDKTGQENQDGIGDDGAFRDMSYLLAAAFRYLNAQELFMPQEAGSRAWMAAFDSRLCAFVTGGDEAGFEPMWFGGEEDYDDNDTNVELYRRKRQQEKLKVVVLRLIHDTFLTETDRARFQAFLKHALLYEDAEAFWQALVGTYKDDSCLIHVLADAGCLQDQPLALRMLSDICPEGKAILLACCAKQTQQESFFNDMRL